MVESLPAPEPMRYDAQHGLTQALRAATPPHRTHGDPAPRSRDEADAFTRMRAGAMRDLAATDPVLARRPVVAALAKNKLAAVKEVRARRGLPPLSVTP